MPRYTVINAPTFLGGTMRQPGEVVEYDGWPGSTLEPADDVARLIKAAYGKVRRLNHPRQPDIAKFAAKVAPVATEPVKDNADG